MDLAKEVTQWVADKIISEDQASSICQRYGINYHDQESHSYGYYVLITLGYLFIDLSLITLKRIFLKTKTRRLYKQGRVFSVLKMPGLTNELS